MSVSDTGPRPRPTDTTYPGAPAGGPNRRPPAKGRGRWALVAVVVLAALVIGWVLTHRNAPAAAGGGAGGPPGAAGGRGGRGGGAGGGGGMGGVTSVNAAKAATADVPVYVTALGTVTPAATVTVRTQLAGQLFTVNFREGQTVAKGQVLAQVDPRPYQQALAQAQGNLQRDQATLANAQLDLKRYQTLLAQDSIARQTVDTQASTVRQAQGTVTFDKAAVAAAQLNLNYTRITAPVSGRVGLRQVDPGNYVANGDTNGIVTITQVNPIDVVFTVPEDQIGAVAKGMHAGAVPVTVFDRGQTEALAEGTLLTLDNQIDTTTGTVKAKARFSNAGDTLFPNQFVNVRVLVDTLRGSVTVPTSAIQRGQNGLFVYTVDNSNTVHMTAVTTGPAVGENTAIASGLQAGTTVVTDGSDRLREGSRVLLPGDCAPAGGGGGRGGRGGAAGGGGAAAEKPKGNWFTNLFGGKKKDETASASAGGGAAAEPGAGGGRRRGGAGGGGAGSGGQSRAGVGPDGQRCRSVDLSKGPANAMEARTNAMLDQLGLSPDQRAKIQKIRDAGREKMTAAMASGDFAAMRAGRTEISKQMEAVMTPAQRTKYEELRAQMQAQAAAGGGFGGMGGGGVGAAGGAPVGAPPAGGAAPATTSTSTTTTTSTTTRGRGASSGSAAAAPSGPTTAPRAAGGGRGAGMFAELGLSPAQQAKIDAIRAEYGPKIRAAYGSGDTAAGKSASEEMRAKMEAVMTPEQRTKAAAIRERMRAQGGGAGGGPGGAF